jgi:predicted metalloprotease with PDZ domain
VRRAILPLLLGLGLAPCLAGACRGGDAPGASEPAWPGLTLDLTPDPARGEVGVELRLSGERAAAVTELGVARAWGDTHGVDAIGELRARDADGELALTPRSGEGPDHLFALARAPRGGELRVRYRARAGRESSRFGLRLDQDRLSGVGHAFLLLPRVGASIPARIRFHLGAMRPGVEGASSFGRGDAVTTTATSEELAHAAYVAGKLWVEEPARTEDAGKSLVVLGNPPFDTRTAFDRVVAELRAVDRFFGREPAPAPFTFLLIGEPGAGDAHEGAALTRSLGVWLDAARRFDGELSIAVAHELVHRFLGESVRLVQPDGREAMWFSEGFTVHFARKLLLDGGMITPADFLADLRGTVDEPAAAEGPRARDYRRGALLAAAVDSAVRARSLGARSLDDVVRGLLGQARAAGRPELPVAALRAAVERDVSPAALAELDRMQARPDDPVDLPGDAFGPCFHRALRESSGFDLGFDRESLSGTPAIIRGLVKGSAADRAGVREGALVIASRLPSPADAAGGRAEVDLTLADRGGGKRVRYRPVGTRRALVWEAKACKTAP